MFVIKRSGKHEAVHFDKISARIHKQCYGLKDVDHALIAQRVCAQLVSGISTAQLDELAAIAAIQKVSENRDYGVLAARLIIDSLHKETSKSFTGTMEALTKVERNGRTVQLVDPAFVTKCREMDLDSHIAHHRDLKYDYFGIKTLLASYLLKNGDKTLERPQFLHMRVAAFLNDHKQDILDTYAVLSHHWYTHATPSMHWAGTINPGMSSCYLLTMKEDSVDGVMDTYKQCALIAAKGGGIGLDVSTIRAEGSIIGGNGGNAKGLCPMLQMFNGLTRYIDQGSKRKMSVAIYTTDWHADIFDVLELRKNTGAAETRARDLFYAVWLSDLFMNRVESDGVWSLMCPKECPGLAECHSAEFEKLYTGYEAQGKFRKQIKARDLFNAIFKSLIETGNPYILFKDHINRKSNQQNLGTIRSSNLCAEIVEYTSPDEVAVCNLASIALPKFVDATRKQFPIPVECKHKVKPSRINGHTFNHELLYFVAKMATRNLNHVIDKCYYPIPEAANSNLKHRPIGIGVQGLHDVFQEMGIAFDSEEAAQLNAEIFETIYFAALETSWELAKKDGPYSSFKGSPASEGKLQFDLWGQKPGSRWPWEELKENIKKDGVRNSLLTALMPTASTSQILANCEGIDPLMSNVFYRRTQAGEFPMINRRLQRDLEALGLWTPELVDQLKQDNGSVQNLEIPENLKNVYKTVWEISEKSILEQSAGRGIYVDQTQSLNSHFSKADYKKVTSWIFLAWKLGLKTASYYLRIQPAQRAQKTRVRKREKVEEPKVCRLKNPDCEACGS